MTNETATQKSGLWKPWKNKLRFPTVPTAPPAADISRQKAAGPKQQTIVYTKHLTLPLAALGSVVLASTCCLPMFPLIFAAGAAGSSAFFAKARPFLLAASILSIGFAFYQRWRAKQCQCKPSLLSTIVLWFSVVTVLTFFLFPQVIANLVANVLAR